MQHRAVILLGLLLKSRGTQELKESSANGSQKQRTGCCVTRTPRVVCVMQLC